VGSQQPCTVRRNMVYPLIRTPRLPADLNGLVRFAERPNLVSAHVPSRFERAVTLHSVGSTDEVHLSNGVELYLYATRPLLYHNGVHRVNFTSIASFSFSHPGH